MPLCIRAPHTGRILLILRAPRQLTLSLPGFFAESEHDLFTTLVTGSPNPTIAQLPRKLRRSTSPRERVSTVPVTMVSAKSIAYYVFHPNELRSIIQW